MDQNFNKPVKADRPEDNDELFELYSKSRDVAVRNEIVKRYTYLAEIISRKFLNRGVEYEDIYQVACIALIKAVERFDPGKGFKFVSFATPTIVGEIKRYFRDKSSAIRIPRRIYEVYQKVNMAKDHLSQELNRAPRVDEIAAYLDIKPENVLEIVESWNVYNIQSFDQNAYNDDDIELHETIGDNDAAFERIENKDFLEKSLSKFNEAEREFIKLRYFNRKTQKEIAERMGVSQMYISRLEKKVLDRFRTMLYK
jgi:RNA polymerase sigma-B factor